MVEDDFLFGLLLLVPILLKLLYEYVRKQRYLEMLKRANIAEIDIMEGIQFEHYLQQLFLKLGYRVEITRASGDFGADLILTTENTKIVVQAKRFGKNVGLKAVQEVYGAKNHYGASKAWVVTNSFYTKQAKELAQSNDVSLIDRHDLLDLILTAKDLESPEYVEKKLRKLDILSGSLKVIGYTIAILCLLIAIFVFI